MKNDQYESLISSVAEKSYGILESFVDSDLLMNLRKILLSKLAEGEMHQAGVGRRYSFVENTKVRGDLISWIEPDNANLYEEMFFDWIDQFLTYLNQTCYTNLKGYEFHYAYYDIGSFYKRHLDQFKSDSGRKFSFVCYLNPHWDEKDGGQLVLYTPNEKKVIQPRAGTVCFFKSDEIEHEVLETLQPRLSITGWLKT